MRADVVYEDDDVVAFRDINPQAPVHVLVIPRKHITGYAGAEEGDASLLGRVALAAAEVARRQGLADGGFRIVNNTGADAGQSVNHLHLHLLGGMPMGWPPYPRG